MNGGGDASEDECVNPAHGRVTSGAGERIVMKESLVCFFFFFFRNYNSCTLITVVAQRAEENVYDVDCE